MEVTGPPVLLCDLKSDRQEVLMAVLLPVAAGIRMAVQTKDERAHWINVQWVGGVSTSEPRRRPSFARKANPGSLTFEDRLSIRRFSVSLLASMAGEKPVGICRLPALHGSRSRGQFSKECVFMIFVPDVIALEHNTTLELSGRIVLTEFRSLLHADIEDTSYVGLLVQPFSIGGDISPLSNFRFIPTALST